MGFRNTFYDILWFVYDAVDIIMFYDVEEFFKFFFLATIFGLWLIYLCCCATPMHFFPSCHIVLSCVIISCLYALLFLFMLKLLLCCLSLMSELASFACCICTDIYRHCSSLYCAMQALLQNAFVLK